MLPRTFLSGLAIAVLASFPLNARASSEAPWWVTRTVQRYLPDAQIIHASKNGDDYDITYQRDGHKGTATIEESGRLLEIDEDLSFASVPTDIQKIVRAQIEDGSISSIELAVKHGVLEYTFKGKVNKKLYALTIDQNNKVLARKLR